MVNVSKCILIVKIKTGKQLNFTIITGIHAHICFLIYDSALINKIECFQVEKNLITFLFEGTFEHIYWTTGIMITNHSKWGMYSLNN